MASASETATVSAHGPCTPYNREPVDSVTVFKATYVWGCNRVCSCNRSPALLTKWPGSFTTAAVIRGWSGYPNEGQHRKLTLKKEKKMLLLGLERRPFNHESDALPLSYCCSRLNRRFPEITGKDNLTVFLTPGEWSPLNGGGSWEEPICDSFRSSGMDLL